MKKNEFTGINIQYPISRLILTGKKTIETRTYPIPKKYIGCQLIIIETPGKGETFSARMIGLVSFGDSFKYANASEFYKDSNLHFVDKSSPWKWNNSKPKWGWPIISITPFKKEIPAPKRKGIKYTTGISL